MATMPPSSPTGQPASATAWFASAAGRALLHSEQATVERALGERPAQPWLRLSPQPLSEPGAGRSLALAACEGGWRGAIRCALPLPLPSETFATVVLQHVGVAGASGEGLFEECARILVPGGRLWLFALNPLAPYRWRWRGQGLRASEPLAWRRRLRAVGLQPDPVSEGLGPTWSVGVDGRLQSGPGLRSAYLLRAEKRSLPLTPLRQRAPLRVTQEAATG